MLAKNIRAHIENYLPQNIGHLAIYAQSIRNNVQERLSSMSDKRHFWENFFNGNIANYFLNDNQNAVTQEVEAALSNPKTPGWKTLYNPC